MKSCAPTVRPPCSPDLLHLRVRPAVQKKYGSRELREWEAQERQRAAQEIVALEAEAKAEVLAKEQVRVPALWAQQPPAPSQSTTASAIAI